MSKKKGKKKSQKADFVKRIQCYGLLEAIAGHKRRLVLEANRTSDDGVELKYSLTQGKIQEWRNEFVLQEFEKEQLECEFDELDDANLDAVIARVLSEAEDFIGDVPSEEKPIEMVRRRLREGKQEEEEEFNDSSEAVHNVVELSLEEMEADFSVSINVKMKDNGIDICVSAPEGMKFPELLGLLEMGKHSLLK